MTRKGADYEITALAMSRARWDYWVSERFSLSPYKSRVEWQAHTSYSAHSGHERNNWFILGGQQDVSLPKSLHHGSGIFLLIYIVKPLNY